MDYCDALPAWQQYAIQTRLNDLIATAQQLSMFGVGMGYPWDSFSIRTIRHGE
jgi:hypothetical protein